MEHIDFEIIKITIEGGELDFLLAKRLGEDLASSIASDPMLIAWFDGKKVKNTRKFQNASTSLVG